MNDDRSYGVWGELGGVDQGCESSSSLPSAEGVGLIGYALAISKKWDDPPRRDCEGESIRLDVAVSRS